MRHRVLLIRLAAALVLFVAMTAAGAPASDEPVYAVRYDALVVPSERLARVTVRIPAHAGVLRSIHWRVEPDRHFDFEGNGRIVREGDVVSWEPPPQDARFRYGFRIDHLRDDASYDARCSENWALFRGGDLVPPARVIARKGAVAEARLRLRLPKGWTVASALEPIGDGSFRIDDPLRRFDRPTGWLVMGHLGVVREKIAGTRVAIAGPVKQGLRRQDILALLRWTLPSLRDVVGALPERLLVVGADDPMWRGGLSGPHSVYVHAERPLISSDGSSPLLHELVHSVTRAHSGPDGDWIAEGLAELYSLEVLVRSKTMSRRRFERSLRTLRKRGESVQNLGVKDASGDVTARAVTVLSALDREIEQATDGAASLDDVMQRLASDREPITRAHLQSLAEEVAGRDLDAFFRLQAGASAR